MSQEELYLGHKDIMSENNLKQSDLPVELNNAIVELNLRIADYQSNPNATQKKSIEQKSAYIAHDILDWVEKDLPDEPEGVENTPASPPAPSNKPADNENQIPKNTENPRKGGIFDWLF